MPSTGIPAGLNANDVAAGDLNGDGIADIAVGLRFNPGSGVVSQVAVFLGYGNGAFAFAPGSGFPAHPDVQINIFTGLSGTIEAIDVGDINGDNLMDLAYGAYGFGVHSYVQSGGSSTGPGWPGTGGFVPLASTFGGEPYGGNAAFGLSLTNAAGGLSAILAAGDVPGPVGLPGVPGATLWVNPFLSSQLLLIEGMTSAGGPGQGSWSIPAPIPFTPSFAGVHVFAQFGIADPGAAGGLALSNGLRLSVSN